MTDPLLFCAWCGEPVSKFYAYDDTCRGCRNDHMEERAGGSPMENAHD